MNIYLSLLVDSSNWLFWGNQSNKANALLSINILNFLSIHKQIVFRDYFAKAVILFLKLPHLLWKNFD